MIPVGQQRAQRGGQRDRLVEHDVVARDRDLDERSDPAEPVVDGLALLRRDQPVLRPEQRDPAVELDIFLTSASPDQRAIVRTLRDIISRRAGDLAERVNKDKELTGYLLFEGPGDRLVFAIGLTAARTVTLHLMPYYGSRELQDRHGAALGPFQVGKSCLRTRSARLPARRPGTSRS